MRLLGKISDFAATLRAHRSMPLRLEFVLTDACNLNCKGCTHYSPLAPREFEPLERLRASMKHLGKVCGSEIKRAYLIGGEPLLYPGIDQAIRALRHSFAHSELLLFTNGIALPQMPEAFWQAAHDADMVIAITRYPIRFDYDAAIALCRERGVRTEVFADRGVEGSFLKFPLDPQKRCNPRVAHFKCFNRGCVSVVGDYVYPCSVSGCVEHLNRSCGTTFRHEKGDRIRVADVRSAADIRRLRDRPVPFCGYCAAPVASPYAPSRRSADEWVLGADSL